MSFINEKTMQVLTNRRKIIMKKFNIFLSVIIVISICLSGFNTIVFAASEPVWPVGGNGGTDLKNWHKYSSGAYHSGTDISATEGTEIYAAYSGTVDTVKSMNTSYGNHVIIKSKVNSKTVYIYYCHMKKYVVKAKQKVDAGQLIGYVGETGNATGPHLHYEVRDENKRYGSNSKPNLNPHNYLPSKKTSNQKPAKPKITSCGATSATSIEIKWDKVSGADKYKIVRHEVDGAKKKTITDNCTKTSYTDKKLESGHTYYYVVYAGKGKKWSDASKEWKTYTKPATPAQPEVNRETPNQLTITWKAVSGASKYKLEYHRADDVSNKWKSVPDNADYKNNYTKKTSYTHKGLADGTKYNYRVIAIREGEIGQSGNKKLTQVKSDPSPIKTKFTKMSRPKNEVDNDNPSHVILSWSAVHGDKEKEYTYGYNVYRDGKKINNDIIKGTSYTDTGAGSDKVHKYEIEIMENGKSRGRNGMFYAGAKITKEIRLEPQNTTSMKISWDKPAGAPNGVKYTLMKYNYSTEKYETYKENLTSTSFTDSNLNAGKSYRYYVQVRDSAGNYITSTFGKSAKLEIVPKQITLNKATVALTEGESINLTASINPNESFDKSIKWASTDNSVATVDKNGTVIAVSAGNAEITATTSNNISAKCTVKVNSAQCSHEYGEWVTDVEPTCENPGSKHRVCTKCKEEEKDTISAAGHSYSEELQTVKEPTCTEDGEQARVCTVCGALTDNAPIEATGHTFGDWTSEKTVNCNEEGTEYRECSKCGERETRTIETTAHNYELKEQIEPTLDGPGQRTYTCTICSDTYSEEYVPEVKEGIVEIGNDAQKAGGIITLPVSIRENPGISGFTFTVNYDKSVMTPTTITRGTLLQNGTFTTNLEQGIPASELKEVAVYWGDSANITENGELFNISFEVNSNAPQGMYPVTLSYEKGDITNAVFDDVMPDILDNVVTIADVVRGDVNQDRRVDSQDELLLSRYIAKWNVTFNESQMKAANVFADSAGKINSKDGVRLSQILSGYELIENAETVSLMSVPEVNLALENITAEAGESVMVPVTISENDGIAGFNFTLNYDKEYLTPISITKGDILLDGNFTSNLTDDTDGAALDCVTAYWNSSYDMADDGELFAVEFLVKENVETGQELPIQLSYEEGGLCDYRLNDVNGVTTQGAVTIAETSDKADGDLQDEYYFNDIIIKSADGSTYESLPKTGNVDLEIGLETIYETAAEALPATILIAAYDETGSLLLLKSTDITEEMLNNKSCNIHIDETKTEIADAKIFVWNTIKNMVPLAQSVSVNTFLIQQ